MTTSTGHRDLSPPNRNYPDLDWVLATELRHLRPGDWIPLLVEFDASAIPPDPDIEIETELNAFLSLRWLPEGLRGSVYVPEIFFNPPAILTQSKFPFSVMWIWRDQLSDVIRQIGWSAVIVQVDLGPPRNLPRGRNLEVDTPRRLDTTDEVKNRRPSDNSPDADEPPTRRMAPPSQRGGITLGWLARLLERVWSFVVPISTGTSRPQVSGYLHSSLARNLPQPVLTAVLDEGIAFAHERFKSINGTTRIAYFWNQDGKTLNPPFNLFGAELDDVAINAAANAAKGSGLCDEASAYLSTENLNFSVDGYKAIAHRRAHGTHVLDLAAGSNPADAPQTARSSQFSCPNGQSPTRQEQNLPRTKSWASCTYFCARSRWPQLSAASCRLSSISVTVVMLDRTMVPLCWKR